VINIKPTVPYHPESMTVLVLDDQDPIRKAIRRILVAMGFGNVLECTDGSEAIKLLGKNQIDLVVADIYMRKISGFQVLKRIRAQNFGADIPVIIVTGEGSKEDIVKAADLGADDYILKPFHVSDIEKKVTSVLTKYHSPPPLLKLLRQGDKLSVQGQLTDAIKLFEAAERLDPESARAKFSRAMVLEKMGQSEDALVLLKKCTSSHSSYYKSFAAIADISINKKNNRTAIDALKSELELNPKQPARQTLLADLLIASGDCLGAIHHFRESLKENPKGKDALIGMGNAYESSGNHEKAIYYYRRARRQHPTFTKALELMVQCFERQRAPSKAVTALLDEVHQNQGRADARIILANLYVKMKELTNGLKILDEGIAREPQTVEFLTCKGRILLNANDTANACDTYKKAIALEPTDKNYVLYGIALMHNHQHKEAYHSLFAALHNTQDKQKILTLIADLMKRMGSPAQALTLLNIAKNTPGGISKRILDDDIKASWPEFMAHRTATTNKKTG
jgi:two-component system, chemotaxis family, chemotaxis protein CheY